MPIATTSSSTPSTLNYAPAGTTGVSGEPVRTPETQTDLEARDEADADDRYDNVACTD
jgi:hypothetical protein